MCMECSKISFILVMTTSLNVVFEARCDYDVTAGIIVK